MVVNKTLELFLKENNIFMGILSTFTKNQKVSLYSKKEKSSNMKISLAFAFFNKYIFCI